MPLIATVVNVLLVFGTMCKVQMISSNFQTIGFKIFDNLEADIIFSLHLLF